MSTNPRIREAMRKLLRQRFSLAVVPSVKKMCADYPEKMIEGKQGMCDIVLVNVRSS